MAKVLPFGWHWPALLNPRRSLRARFALLLGGSGLAFALLSALVMDGYQRAQLIDSQGQSMRREALLLSRSLNQALERQLHTLNDAASQPLLASGLMEPGDLRLLLESLRGQEPALAWAGVIDLRGRVRVATNALLEDQSVGEEVWFVEALKHPWLGSRRPGTELAAHLGLVAGNTPYLIDIAVPLRDPQGRTWGVLAGRLRWEWLEAAHLALQPLDRRLPGGDSLVVDRHNRVLLGPPQWLGRAMTVSGMAALRDGAAARVLTWPDEGEFLTAVAQDRGDAALEPTADLTVVMRQPAALAFASADAMRRRLLLLGLLATLGFVAISVWLAGRVARPISALSEEASRVGSGSPPDFQALAPHRTDEVAELARRLQALHLELGQRLLDQERASARYEALFRTAPMAVYFNVGGRLQMANQACLELFGADQVQRLQGKTYADLYHPDDHATLAARQAQLRERWSTGQPLPIAALRIVRTDGSLATVEQSAMPVAVGEARGVQVMLRDVTAQRRAQALLALREAQLIQTSRMARVGGWQLDLISGLATWTDEMARIYELEPETRPTRDLALSYFQGEYRERLQAAITNTLRSGEPYDLELQLVTPSGVVKWVRAQARLVTEAGRPTRLEGITQDVTERRAAEEAVRELNAQLEQRVAERTAELQAANAELDSFAYAVSHDLRAPLRAMSGFSQALVEDYGSQLEPGAQAYLDQIAQGSQRMGGLIEGLLVLSRTVRGELRTDTVDLSALAARALVELRRAEPERKVRVHIEPQLVVQGDRRMLDAAILNLMSNAWKYSAKAADAQIEFRAEVIDGERWFSLSDNGAGFDMAHAGRLFKAFARLHRQDEFTGIGIGLATVQRIVHRHGGRIAAEGQPGRGARFRFTLPASRATASDPQERAKP